MNLWPAIALFSLGSLMGLATPGFGRSCYTFVNSSGYLITLNFNYSWPIPENAAKSIDLAPAEKYQFCFEDTYPASGFVFAEPVGGSFVKVQGRLKMGNHPDATPPGTYEVR